MSRKRTISTDISTDGRVAELAAYGTLPLLVYTWAVPHADDWGRLTGDARQFKLLICPALDVTANDIDEALDQIAECGLWTRYEVDGKKCIAFPYAAWIKHQSYINAAKRGEDKSSFPAPPGFCLSNSGENTEELQLLPNNSANHRRTPQNTSSPSPSPTKTINNSLDYTPTSPATSAEGDAGQSSGVSRELPIVESPPPRTPPRTQPRTVKRKNSSWTWLACVPADIASHADRFEEFYAAYPRKEAPKDAWTAWKRLALEWSEDLGERIAASLQAHIASEQWRDKSKIPHPATWISQRRWEGEPPPVTTVGVGATPNTLKSVPQNKYQEFVG